MGPLETDSLTPAGEAYDLVDAYREMQKTVANNKITGEGPDLGDFLVSEAWLSALSNKGQQLIDDADKRADEDSHGRVAKDQHEKNQSGTHKDHAGAGALAAAANKLIFGPLKTKVMQEEDFAKAEAALQKQVSMIDQVVAAPHSGHPLWGLVPERKKATDGGIPAGPPPRSDGNAYA